MALDAALQSFFRADRLTLEQPAPLADLEGALSYRFRNPELLTQATTHSAAGHGRGGTVDNERLEFLGDC